MEIWKKATINTFLECICSTSLSVLIGFIYAYAVHKTKIPFKNFFSFIPILHLLTPPFVGGLSFILLLGKQGFITHTLLGLDVSLYGFKGLLIAQTLCFFPISYMICGEAIKGIDQNLIIAAKSLGAGHIKTFFTITLPLCLPSIFSSMLFIAVSVMSDFGNPMIVGGRFRVLAVEIYTQLTGWMNWGTSTVLGIILLIPSITMFIFQNKLTKKNLLKTATSSEKKDSLADETLKSCRIIKIFMTVFCIFISFCVLAQFIAIIAGSFQKLWGIDTTFTLKHIQNLKRCTKELSNSFSFSLISALLSTFIGGFCVFFVYRTNAPIKKYFDIIAQLPAAIPGTLFGLAISIAASKFKFTNSAFLIIIAITIGFMPFSFRSIASKVSQINSSLDDAASSLGAGKIKTYFTIILPLSKGAFFNAFVYNFVRGVGTMSAVIFLVSFNTPLASIKILNLAEQGFWGDAAALALLLTIITFAIIGICKFILFLGSKFWTVKKLH
ncbi:MAG: iron ABC transporter permease [Spirochaetia bacterium]|nr:iron ABC transporter permease [Spirochaetia bacterium]